MGNLQFTDEAWEEFSRLVLEERNKTKKILKLLEDIKRNGIQGIGKTEPLIGDLSGYWSKRIDKKNRIVFRMLENDVVEISQVDSHYGDK